MVILSSWALLYSSTTIRLKKKKKAGNFHESGKVPGQDKLNAELFKTDQEIPDDWSEGVIIRITMKGNLRDCNNWQGIILLSISSKILAKIIIQHISDVVDQKLRNKQAGFCRGRGCTDQIFALRNIIEQCTEWQRQLYINFANFEKAFDSLQQPLRHTKSVWDPTAHSWTH